MNPGEDSRNQPFSKIDQSVGERDHLQEEITAVKKRAQQAEFELRGLGDLLSPDEQSAVGRQLQRIVDEAEAIELDDVDVELVDPSQEARDEMVSNLVEELRTARANDLAAHIEEVYAKEGGGIDWRALVQHTDRPVSWLIKYGDLFTHVAPKQIWEELRAKNKPDLGRDWLLQARKHELFDEEELFILMETEVHADPRLVRELTSHKFSQESLRQLVIRAYDVRYALGASIESCLGGGLTREKEEHCLLSFVKHATATSSSAKNWWREGSDVVRIGAWSPEDVSGFLQKHGITNVDIQWLFGVPPLSDLTPVHEAGSILRPFVPSNPDQRAMQQEWTRFVEEAKNADRVIDGFCERVLRVDVTADRATREALRSVKIVGVKELSGTATAPLLLALEGTNTPAVYKTPQREPNLVKDAASAEDIAALKRLNRLDRLEKPVIEGVRQFEAFRREWLCSAIDRIFDFQLVPPLVLRNGPEGIGMVQKWEAGFSGAYGDWKTRVEEQKIIKLALFHYLVWHCDGHDGNFNLRPDGELTAFDNGYSFSLEPSSVSGAFASEAAQFVAGKEVPEELKKSLRYIVEIPTTQKLLKEVFAITFRRPDEAEFHLNGFLNRIDFMAPKDPNKVSRIPPSQKTYTNT